MTVTKHTVPHNSVEAEALRCERDAVTSEFKKLTDATMKMTGLNEGVAMLVMERLTLAYEIGAEMRERGGRGVVRSWPHHRTRSGDLSVRFTP